MLLIVCQFMHTYLCMCDTVQLMMAVLMVMMLHADSGAAADGAVQWRWWPGCWLLSTVFSQSHC